MCDQVHRLDSQIGEFLKFLEGTAQRVLVVMTGDASSSESGLRSSARRASTASSKRFLPCSG